MIIAQNGNKIRGEYPITTLYFRLSSKSIECNNGKLQMFDDVPGVEDVEGEMTIPANKRTSGSTSKAGPPDFDTLDEPIKDTIVKLILAGSASQKM